MYKEELRIIDEELYNGECMNIGYAYLDTAEGSKEYVFDMTPKNIACFIDMHQQDAEKIVLTDILDRLILNTYGGFIDYCPDQELCRQITMLLAPMQMGEKEPEDFPYVSREAFEYYGYLEDQKVTAMELAMM